MPFFRRKQVKAEKTDKLEHQLHLARHAPGLEVDLSDCGLADIPHGVYALCKVLLKESLLLYTNKLTTLDESGSSDEIEKAKDSLRLLDVHDNHLKELPPEIGSLRKLQVLNAAENKLRSLPKELSQLSELQTLNLKGNGLTSLPDWLGELKSLRSLNVAGNGVTRLPLSLARLTALESLVVDAVQMVDPPAETCALGTEAMMRALSKAAGREYTPPSHVVLPLLTQPHGPHAHLSAAMERRRSHSDAQLDYLAESAAQYDRSKECRRKELAQLQQSMLESRSQRALQIARNDKSKQRLLGVIAQEQSTAEKKFNTVQVEKDRQREQLMRAIKKMEKHADELYRRICETNAELAEKENRLEEEEARRMAEDEWCRVKLVEYERLRKEEIQRSMAMTIAQNYSLKQIRDLFDKQRQSSQAQILQQECRATDSVDAALRQRDVEVKRLLDGLLRDQRLQKEALLTLMEERDARTHRLNTQIELIQRELAQLSGLERQQRTHKQQRGQLCLDNERRELTKLLVQLMYEKDMRNKQLQKRLLEMEKAHEDSQVDYWLVQYQKLLDSKPQPLIDRETQLDVGVLKVLQAAGAVDYEPAFARHAVTAATLPSLTALDLQRMSQDESALRFTKLSEYGKAPERQTDGSAGYDLFSAADCIVPAGGGKVLCPTDIQIAFPHGCYARIAPRSGLALHNSIHIGAGVVDSDFRGPLGILLFNFGAENFQVQRGMRVAQLILERILCPVVIECDSLPPTNRGCGGFGSTGV